MPSGTVGPRPGPRASRRSVTNGWAGKAAATAKPAGARASMTMSMMTGAISSSRFRDLARKAGRYGVLPLLIVAGALTPSIYLACHDAPDLPNLGFMQDDAVYLVTAKSIADGSGYRLLHVPRQPHQILYPPFYPLLLSAAWRFQPRFPDNASVALFSSWLMLPLLLVITDRLAAAMGAQPAARILLSVWIALNPIVIFYSVNLMSELMFCCGVTACVWMVIRALQPGAAATVALSAGLAGGIAYLTKSAGIFLLPAALICFAGLRSYRKGILFAAGMLPAIATWQMWTRMHVDDPGSYEGYRTYLSHFAGLSWSQFAAIAGVNIKLIFLRPTGLLVWFLEGAPFLQFAITFSALAMVAYCVCSPLRPQFAAGVAVACYVGMLCVWPNGINSRLLLPAMPVLLAIFVSLARTSWIRNPLVFAILSFAGVSNGVVTYAAAFGVMASSIANDRRAYEQNQPVYDWLRVNSLSTPLVTDRAALVYLRTGRPALEPLIPVADWYRSPRELGVNFSMRMVDIARSTGGFLLTHCSASDESDNLPLCSASIEMQDIHLIADTKSAKLFRVDLRPPQ